MTEAEEQKSEVKDAPEINNREGLPFADTTMSLQAQAPAELQPGVILLEKFKIIELLGVGGMGSVYRVEHLFMNQQYALKCLNKCQRNDINWRRFENEAKAANMLDHANLLRVFEFGLLPGGRPYFLMELVNGVTLADEIKKLGRLPMKRAIKIFIQVAFAIQYAHEHHIIHRDLKPSNIMIELKDGEESVKVVDFGIAKLTGVDEFNQQTLTKTGEIFGSPLYMSPEQCAGTAIDNRSDLYSLGCLFYEALTGAPPFIGDTAIATMMKHQQEPPLSLKEASMGIGFPIGLEKVIANLLQKDPNQRYQKANSLAADLIELERSLSGEGNGSTATAIGELRADRGKSLAKEREGLSNNTIFVSALALAMGTAVGAGSCYYVMSGQIKEIKIYYESRMPKESPFASNAPNTVSPQANGDSQRRSAPPPLSSYSKIAGDQRVLRFPKGVCLGTIIDDFAFVCEAEGEKIFPKQRRLSLMVRNDAIAAPELLAGFAPDDLVFLNFSSAEHFRSDGFSNISHMTGLKAINAKHTLFNDSALTSLDKLINLRYANFNDTRIHGDGLRKSEILKNLNAIDISNTSGVLPFCQKLSELTNLYELQMQNCQLDDVLLKDISQCKPLRVLCVSQNRDITDAGISYLTDLKDLNWLDLSSTSVSPNCLESLVNMPPLKKLELAEMDWTEKQKKEFEKNLKNKLPAIKIYWTDEETSDLSKNLPDFKWDAGNLR